MDKNLGKKIKELRKKKKMTLKHLSERSGLSVSFISQLERAVSSVTVTSLKKIAEGLGVEVHSFFQDQIDKKSISPVKKGVDSISKLKTNKFSYVSLLGEIENPIFEPMLVSLMPGEIENVPYSHSGQEFIYVLTGSLTVILEDNTYILSEGDSIYIDSQKDHNWYNNTKEEVRLLLVNTNKINSIH